MFSIIIPLYNKRNFIRKTLESVLSQELKDFEVIIVNDGSDDDSVSQIENISDSRINIINQINQGVGAARNNGMLHANFEWIAFLDGDDIWAPNHLSELAKIIKEFPLSGMVSTNYETFYSNTEIKIESSKSKANIRSINYFLEPIVSASATAIKKEAFEKLGGFTNHESSEDLIYWARIALDYPVAISDKITSYYRLDTGGISDSIGSRVGKDYFREISSLSNVSPLIEFLVDKLKEESSVLKSSSIKKYINEKLLSILKIWLFRENIPMAKQIAEFGIPDFSEEFFIIIFVRATPKLGIKKAITIYQKTFTLRQKKHLRKIKTIVSSK